MVISMILHKIVHNLRVNCYIFYCPETMEGIIIDPGADAPGIARMAQENGVQIKKIVLTHGHVDHIGAAEPLRDLCRVPVAIHREDSPTLKDPYSNLSSFFNRPINLTADELLGEGDILQVGNLTAKVIHTPGHTPGGICLITEDGLFSGDTLFCEAIGRSDFPGGNGPDLVRSIKEKLMPLDGGLLVFPGHEGKTSIGYERLYNPFLGNSFLF